MNQVAVRSGRVAFVIAGITVSERLFAPLLQHVEGVPGRVRPEISNSLSRVYGVTGRVFHSVYGVTNCSRGTLHRADRALCAANQSTRCALASVTARSGKDDSHRHQQPPVYRVPPLASLVWSTLIPAAICQAPFSQTIV